MIWWSNYYFSGYTQKSLPDSPPYAAFVKLSNRVDDNALRDFFSEHCEVDTVKFMKSPDRQTKFRKVTFKDKESLEIALKADGFELCERSIRVDVYTEPSKIVFYYF